MRVFAGLTFCVALSWASLANAAVVLLNRVRVDRQYLFEEVSLPGPGNYRVDIRTEEEIDAEVKLYYLEHYHVYLAPPSNEPTDLEGDDYDIEEFQAASGRSMTFFFTVPESYTIFFDSDEGYELLGVPRGTPLYRETEYENAAFQIGGQDASSPGEERVNYSVRVSLLTPVPEPSSWALLIGGFGLCGALLRRARPGYA